MSIKTREENLEERAKMALGFNRNENISEKELKKAWRQKAKEHHPDQNDSEDAKKYFQLVREARDYLKGNRRVEMLDTSVVSEYLGFEVDLSPTYEQWRRERFYGDGGSIWPDKDESSESERERKARERYKRQPNSPI